MKIIILISFTLFQLFAYDYKIFHTYWAYSVGGVDVDGSERIKGAILGCNEEGLQNPVQIISLNHDVRSIAVDINRNIYWTDITTGEILKSDPNGRNIKAIIKGLIYPISLTIDNKNNKLYWCDWDNKRVQQRGYISRSNLDGSAKEILISEELNSGGRIKIDEEKGVMYIVDSFGMKIVRANTDGTNMVPIIFSHHPDGFDIDYVRKQMYWTDIVKDSIYVCDYDGGNQKRLYSSGDEFSNPTAMFYDSHRQKIFFAQDYEGQEGLFSIDVNGNNLHKEYMNEEVFQIWTIVQPIP